MSAIEVSYLVEGEGPPLYMVHGIGSRKAGWSQLVPYLSDVFTCVTYDLRGHGESPVPQPPYTLDELVEDLEALRQKLGHEKIHIIGHSLGGMIGPAYAKAFPKRTLTLGLLSTAAGRTESDKNKLNKVRLKLEEVGIEGIIDVLVDRWYTDEFVIRSPEWVELRKEQLLATPESVFSSVFQIYADTEMAPWLCEIMCPCLVLTGEQDGGCNPRLNRFIANELPDAELVILDHLKHSVLIEAPERVAVPVRDFLLRNC